MVVQHGNLQGHGPAPWVDISGSLCNNQVMKTQRLLFSVDYTRDKRHLLLILIKLHVCQVCAARCHYMLHTVQYVRILALK